GYADPGDEPPDMCRVRDTRGEEAVQERRDDRTGRVAALLALAPEPHREHDDRAEETHDRPRRSARELARTDRCEVRQHIPAKQSCEVNKGEPASSEARLDKNAGVDEPDEIQAEVQDVEVNEAGGDEAPPLPVLDRRWIHRSTKRECRSDQPTAHREGLPRHLIRLDREDRDENRGDQERHWVARDNLDQPLNS